jgi:proteasome accessory factor C
VLSADFNTLDTAREKILAAAGGEEDSSLTSDEANPDDFAICRTVNRALREHRLLEIEYLSQEGKMPGKRTVEPYLLRRAGDHWYLVAWCRKRDGIRTFMLEMIKSASLGEGVFEPREIDLERFRSDPRYPSGSEPPKQARVFFSGDVARWVREQQPGAEPLPDGSLVATIPYFNDRWLRDEILKYRGQAVVLEPASMRRLVAESAAALARRYE